MLGIKACCIGERLIFKKDDDESDKLKKDLCLIKQSRIGLKKMEGNFYYFFMREMRYSFQIIVEVTSKIIICVIILIILVVISTIILELSRFSH